MVAGSEEGLGGRDDFSSLLKALGRTRGERQFSPDPTDALEAWDPLGPKRFFIDGIESRNAITSERAVRAGFKRVEGVLVAHPLL